MIDTNLNILMGLSALIHGTLIISLYGCYLRCCNRKDTAVLKLTPHPVSVPVIFEQQERKHQHQEDIEFFRMRLTQPQKNLVACQL